MELVLKRDLLGRVLEGTDELLRQRAVRGDDITLNEVSSTFACYIVFANLAVQPDRVSGLSLPHLAAGDLTAPERLVREPIPVIQYIYDSQQKLLICKDMLGTNRRESSISSNGQHYSSFNWFATRRYVDAGSGDLETLKNAGDQFKVRLRLSADLQIIMKPDIIYFPENGRQFLIKSAGMLLPTELVCDPGGYAQTNRPLIANTRFSLAYLSVGSDRQLTIVHRQLYSVEESVPALLERSIGTGNPTPLLVGVQTRQETPIAQVTRLECRPEILLPEGS